MRTEILSYFTMFSFPIQKHHGNLTCHFSQTYSWNKNGIKLFPFREYGPSFLCFLTVFRTFAFQILISFLFFVC